MQAWKLKDGRYTLISGGVKDKMVLRGLVTRGWATYDPGSGNWTASAETVGLAKIEKVHGVVTGPSSCGCDPPMFRWAGEKEVEDGQTWFKTCPECTRRNSEVTDWNFTYRCDIIDVCGEADVAEAVYEAEFADKLRSLA